MKLENYAGIIELPNDNIKKISYDDIVGYVLVGGNPYGIEGRVYIFTVSENIFKTYRGNVYHGLNREELYDCIPDSYGFFEFPIDRENMHPEGWKMIPYYMGHYCFFPENIADDIAQTWKELSKYSTDPEKRMAQGVYLSYCKECEKMEADAGEVDKNNMEDIRERLIDAFEDTQKFYEDDQILAAAVEYGRKYTKLYQADNYPELQFPMTRVRGSKIRVSKKKTFEAAMGLHKEFPDKKIAVLNFASATRPGGGVLTGSKAQEESLCRCSTLYPTIDRKWLWKDFYDANRAAKDVRHTDDCIYSPKVVICKTDDLIPKRLEPKDFVKVDVISCAAPNLRREPATYHNPESGQMVRMDPGELFLLHYIRAQHILHIAAYNQVDILVLGAFGCGAFSNDPVTVAYAYEKALNIYKGWFDVIEFAIYCRDYETDNYDAFYRKFIDDKEIK